MKATTPRPAPPVATDMLTALSTLISRMGTPVRVVQS